MDFQRQQLLEEELCSSMDLLSREIFFSVQTVRVLKCLSWELHEDPHFFDIPEPIRIAFGDSMAYARVLQFHEAVKVNFNGFLNEILGYAARFDNGFQEFGDKREKSQRNGYNLNPVVPLDGPYVTSVWAQKLASYFSDCEQTINSHYEVDDVPLPLFEKADLVQAFKNAANDYDSTQNRGKSFHSWCEQKIGARYLSVGRVRRRTLAARISYRDFAVKCRLDPSIHECGTDCEINPCLARLFPKDAGIISESDEPSPISCLATIPGILRVRAVLGSAILPTKWRDRMIYALASLSKNHRDGLGTDQNLSMIYELFTLDGASPVSTELATASHVITTSFQNLDGQTLSPGLSSRQGSDSQEIGRSRYKPRSKITPGNSRYLTILRDCFKTLPATVDKAILFPFEKQLAAENSRGVGSYVAANLMPVVIALLSQTTSANLSYPVTVTDIMSLLPGNQLTSSIINFCINRFLNHPPRQDAIFLVPRLFKDFNATSFASFDKEADSNKAQQQGILSQIALFFQIFSSEAGLMARSAAYKTVFIRPLEPVPGCELLAICFLSMSPASCGGIQARESMSCTYTVVAAARQLRLNQTSHLKNHFRLKVERLLQTVLSTSGLNNFDAADSLKSIHLRDIISETPGIVILHTVIQCLKAPAPPLASFVGFAACYFDGDAFLPLPYHPADEDKVREAGAFHASASLLPARALGAGRRWAAVYEAYQGITMPTTELGGQSSSNCCEANKPPVIKDVPQDFLSDHEEFLSDDEEADSDDELLLNAGEGHILLGTSLGTSSEYGSDSLTDAEAHCREAGTDATEDLPPITCDISNENEIEDLINQKMTKEQRNFWQLTSKRLEKILELACLGGLLPRDTVVREELENDRPVTECRRRIEFAIEQHAAQMLSLETTQVHTCGISRTLYLFSVANADKKSRSLLLRLYTDPRLMPYVTQFAFGQRSVPPEVMDLLPDLDPGNAPYWLGIYFIVVTKTLSETTMTTQKTNLKHLEHAIYTGSATSDKGFEARIPQHEALGQLELKELRSRYGRGDPLVLNVHLTMAQPGSKYSFKWGYQLPVIDDPELRPIARLSVVLLEAIFIGMGTLGDKTTGRRPRLKSQSHVLSRRMLRHETLLFKGWTGLNLMSPSFQKTDSGFTTPLPLTLYTSVLQYLEKHYMDTHELRLDMHLAESISERFGLYSYAKRKLRISYVREMYAKVLEIYGQKYLTGLRSSDQKNATALAAIFQQANEDGLVKGPTTDGKYEINVFPR
ncbi:hypothetical protein GP486_002646 [Trichoglossum hirsutum]|uniref:Uncharacterized protein n=1 Tax=Trichoglossum hirsutum TaxID=265104 RepID=A0A9P8LET5_9PEZI|nr:hypothetical protein GP486_002646 [Trichoglossum hirsutum]